MQKTVKLDSFRSNILPDNIIGIQSLMVLKLATICLAVSATQWSTKSSIKTPQALQTRKTGNNFLWHEKRTRLIRNLVYGLSTSWIIYPSKRKTVYLCTPDSSASWWVVVVGTMSPGFHIDYVYPAGHVHDIIKYRLYICIQAGSPPFPQF